MVPKPAKRKSTSPASSTTPKWSKQLELQKAVNLKGQTTLNQWIFVSLSNAHNKTPLIYLINCFSSLILKMLKDWQQMTENMAAVEVRDDETGRNRIDSTFSTESLADADFDFISSNNLLEMSIWSTFGDNYNYDQNLFSINQPFIQIQIFFGVGPMP